VDFRSRRSALPVTDPSRWQHTAYFIATRQRPDRAGIDLDWVVRTAEAPEHERVQADGRVRRWRRIPEADARWLRVVLLPDGRTIHNAFFDRGFHP
jgi:hypothetical protein